MILNQVEMTVHVKGRPITEYNHRGQTFVEGRDGSEYEIEIRNRTAGRIEAVLSVDGLSVIDGKPAGASSSGYMIDAGQTVLIPGWKLDDSTVAKFAFAGKGESYATKMTGDSRNNGVIGVMAFSEKYVAPKNYYGSARSYGPVYASGASSLDMYNGDPTSRRLSPDWTFDPMSRGIGAYPSVSLKQVDNCYSALAQTASDINFFTKKLARGLSAPSSHESLSSNPTNSVEDDYYCSASAAAGSAVNSLGTAFGEATSFETSEVEFERGDLICMMVMYYDEAKGLTARGIQLAKPKRQQSVPDAFPAMSAEGCEPPYGWVG